MTPLRIGAFGCSQTKMAWTPPNSCSPITQYEMRCKTAKNDWERLPSIFGSLTSWTINSSHFLNAPFNLQEGDQLICKIRSRSNVGYANHWSQPSREHMLPKCSVANLIKNNDLVRVEKAKCACPRSCRSTGCGGCCTGADKYWTKVFDKACCRLGTCEGCNPPEEKPMV